MKPKQNGKQNIYVPQGVDACSTPSYALTPLLPYLKCYKWIWEPAASIGLLADALTQRGFTVFQTDLLMGWNFFEREPLAYECQVTNPPFSIKYQWLERSYALGKPFALLLPVETIGAKSAQVLFEKYGTEIIFMHPRVDFFMPNKGWESSAQFPTAWFTWKLDIGKEMTFADISEEKKAFKEKVKEEMSQQGEQEHAESL